METNLNAAGGVLGRPVKIVIEDDKSDAKEAVTAANKLIDQDKAVALIAATGSASTVAVKAITAAEGPAADGHGGRQRGHRRAADRLALAHAAEELRGRQAGR